MHRSEIILGTLATFGVIGAGGLLGPALYRSWQSRNTLQGPFNVRFMERVEAPSSPGAHPFVPDEPRAPAGAAPLLFPVHEPDFPIPLPRHLDRSATPPHEAPPDDPMPELSPVARSKAPAAGEDGAPAIPEISVPPPKPPRTFRHDFKNDSGASSMPRSVADTRAERAVSHRAAHDDLLEAGLFPF